MDKPNHSQQWSEAEARTITVTSVTIALTVSSTIYTTVTIATVCMDATLA